MKVEQMQKALREQANLFTKVREVIVNLPDDKLQLLIHRVISVYIQSLRIAEGVDVHVYKAVLVAYVDMIQNLFFTTLNTALSITKEEEAVLLQAAAILGPKLSVIANVYMKNVDKIGNLLETSIDVATLDEGFEEACENLNQSIQDFVSEVTPLFQVH